MNTSLRQRFTAVAFAALMTFGMLAGVDGLATQEAQVHDAWAHHVPTQQA
jgi:hypothetical protein